MLRVTQQAEIACTFLRQWQCMTTFLRVFVHEENPYMHQVKPEMLRKPMVAITAVLMLYSITRLKLATTFASSSVRKGWR